MSIESRITTEQELLSRGYERDGTYTTAREEYQVYTNLKERLLVQPASKKGILWIIEVCKRGK